MSLPEPELEQCGEGGGYKGGVAVAAAATTLNGNVRSSKHTHTHPLAKALHTVITAARVARLIGRRTSKASFFYIIIIYLFI